MNVCKWLGRWGGCGLLLAVLVLAGCQTRHADSHFADLPGVTGADTAAAAPAPATPPPPAAPEAASPPVSTSAPAAGLPARTTPVVTPTATPTGSPTTGGVPLIDPSSTVSVFQKGDAITITFSDLPIPVPIVEDHVKEDGTITLLQNQTFEVAGKTCSELQKEIRARYVPGFFQTMTVTVNKQPGTLFYYVGGEVKAPGRQVYLGPGVTVLRAVKTAGDFTDFAKRSKVELTRADGRKAVINCLKARKDPRLDLPVFPNDSINVPRSVFLP